MTHPPGYVLNVAATSIDGYRFEELGERGRMLAAGEDHPSALACYDAALALWQGRPLVDLAGLEFAEREADRLEQVRVSVEEFRIDSILAVGGHSSVVGQLTTLVEDHPFRERLSASSCWLCSGRVGRPTRCTCSTLLGSPCATGSDSIRAAPCGSSKARSCAKSLRSMPRDRDLL